MLALQLLLLSERLIERAARGARLYEGLVISGVEFETAMLQMQDELRHVVEQIAVVGDDDHRAAIALQIVFKPQYAFKIEIVRRLVEQQQIRRGEKHRRQRHAHAPSAGIFRTWTKLVFVAETEARENPRRARRRRIRINGFKAVMDVAQLVRIVLCFTLRQKCDALLVRRQHGIEQRHRARWHFLRHLPNAPSRGHAHLAVVGM